MLKRASIRAGLLGVVALAGAFADCADDSSADYLPTCRAITRAASNASTVYYPGDPSGHYAADNEHWGVTSSSASACSVEPGSIADVVKILQIIAATRTPFAVKGGGHATNPGFSSTKGVQIALTRFNQVVNNAATGTVDIGAGLLWDEVYSALDGTGLTVVGGRLQGVGVAGFMLGGGYSWKTNQYGLAVDNVVSFELVLPSGTVTTVTSADADLWFALRGGGNNFGIVTKFTLKSYPQTDVWGGVALYSTQYVDSVNAAAAKFSATAPDKKAVVLPSYSNTPTGAIVIGLLIFYDGPSPPAGIFDDFLAIPYETLAVQTQSFVSFVKSLAYQPDGARMRFSSVPVIQWTDSLLKVVYNESQYWSARLAPLEDPPPSVSWQLDTMDPTYLSHGASSAWPPTRAHPFLPGALFFSWANKSSDSAMLDAFHRSAATIRAAASAEGQDIAEAWKYPNYAIEDTSLQEMYGGNVAKLRAIHARVDPHIIMGLAGGFKF
ncbi:FAD-binding domain-containing protein [Auriscalpium vulgare]|uniref:FAD-binding domain-containing protein n=1 Tax=Auriscalpium vulgare TaxID=40419 RepID=A0ACB8RHN6_9AGAM|nr:FAD-binding domain-containing protein [Auriscalpium vulgare]